MVEVQISLFSSKGYRPMSTILTVPSAADYNEHKEQYKKLAVVKMCQQRSMTTYDLRKYGYNEIRVCLHHFLLFPRRKRAKGCRPHQAKR